MEYIPAKHQSWQQGSPACKQEEDEQGGPGANQGNDGLSPVEVSASIPLNPQRSGLETIITGGGGGALKAQLRDPPSPRFGGAEGQLQRQASPEPPKDTSMKAWTAVLPCHHPWTAVLPCHQLAFLAHGQGVFMCGVPKPLFCSHLDEGTESPGTQNILEFMQSKP